MVLLKNAFANVIRGSFSALMAFILPPFLIQLLPTHTFSVWIIILQLTAYVSYFDFGVQTAVGRFVAYANELGDFQQRDRIVNTSLIILFGSGLLAMLFLALLAWQLPHIFPKIPGELLTDAQIAILLIGSSLAFGLPFSVFNGIFVGIQRYEIPAAITGFSKLSTTLLIIIIAKMSNNLVLMSTAIAGVNIISYFFQFLACIKLNQNIKFNLKLISINTSKEILNYCFSLSIWSFTMILVSGIDTTIVGIFDFKAVAYFAVVATLVNLITGLQNAIFSTLLPIAAVMDAKADATQLGKLLVTSTRYGIFLLLISGMPLILGAKFFLTLWVGQDYAEHGAVVLQLLIIANIIRLSATPYVTLLIGTGQQNLVIISPILEGLSNLISSLVLGSLIGYVGVALGTFVGGIVGVAGNILYNMRRTQRILLSRKNYLLNGLLRPLVCIIPLLIMTYFEREYQLLLINRIALLLITLIATIASFWFGSLLAVERQKILNLVIKFRQ
ncbi:MATE family efflux transporter [Calothrix sp. FACHB-168]|uniref:MATE family efflux transporter n=1 Tax=Calothrix sp. FACHB-168 TaxID=2692780 RepID=UPI0030DDD0F5